MVHWMGEHGPTRSTRNELKRVCGGSRNLVWDGVPGPARPLGDVKVVAVRKNMPARSAHQKDAGNGTRNRQPIPDRCAPAFTVVGILLFPPPRNWSGLARLLAAAFSNEVSRKIGGRRCRLPAGGRAACPPENNACGKIFRPQRHFFFFVFPQFATGTVF